MAAASMCQCRGLCHRRTATLQQCADECQGQTALHLRAACTTPQATPRRQREMSEAPQGSTHLHFARMHAVDGICGPLGHQGSTSHHLHALFFCPPASASPCMSGCMPVHVRVHCCQLVQPAWCKAPFFTYLASTRLSSLLLVLAPALEALRLARSPASRAGGGSCSAASASSTSASSSTSLSSLSRTGRRLLRTGRRGLSPSVAIARVLGVCLRGKPTSFITRCTMRLHITERGLVEASLQCWLGSWRHPVAQVLEDARKWGAQRPTSAAYADYNSFAAVRGLVCAVLAAKRPLNRH